MIKDKQVIDLLDIIINHPVSGNCHQKGLPIGNLTSQHFANLYLGELDHFVKEHLRVKGYIRYMDDFICFADDKRVLSRLLVDIRQFLCVELKLDLKDKMTLIAPVMEGVPFLGFRIFKSLMRLQRPNIVRFRKRLMNLESGI